MGLDTGDPRVLTTKPYYRAPYVFIQRKDYQARHHELGQRGPGEGREASVSRRARPAQMMLEKIGLFNREHFNYMNSLTNFQDKRNKFTRIPPAAHGQ